MDFARTLTNVTPAKAGVHRDGGAGRRDARRELRQEPWAPAFAGVTTEEVGWLNPITRV